jgi:hypothetical protein
MATRAEFERAEPQLAVFGRELTQATRPGEPSVAENP